MDYSFSPLNSWKLADKHMDILSYLMDLGSLRLPSSAFEASQLADCAATSFMLITWVPEQEIWSLRNHKVHNRVFICIIFIPRIHCISTKSNVIGIGISCSQLQGTIHFNSSLFSLQHLKRLNLSYNDFSGSKLSPKVCPLKVLGSYPRLLPNLTQITSSDLSHNNFGSQIPWSFLKLGQLSFLDLSFNSFTCQLLDVSTNLAELSSSNSQPVSHTSLKLEFLALSYNLLNGTIPSWLYSTPRLQHLYLDNNLFTRHIDEFQYNLVRYLDLSNNNLVGPLPMAIYKLVSLYHIYVSFNHLSGTMESKMFSKLKILETVDLSHNPLLSLSTFNNFSYTLPKLYELYLSSCKINEFPFFLTNLENLEWLDLSHNQIKGNTQTWLLDVAKDSLRYLNLSNNFLINID
ncbi:hypothetical protein CMV_026676 [Castanea mollissima]|uniref:Uncharacterized protein n=1 Tax=Castanea mollissima TaxID=60419 RepID=A0A8J4V7B7_9ROSI|nr:hypothetical protein CMV_026676 [Castanea mollissima]